MPRNIDTNWTKLTDEQLLTRSVYVGAYGWKDCDAIGRIWARNTQRFEQAMTRAMRDEVKRADDEDATPRPTLADMWYIGPFLTPLAGLAGMLDEPDLITEMLDNLRADMAGWVY
jgi:hypothetical protein